MAEERLPQLAVWLDTKSSALQSLYLNLQLIDCDWAALEDALEPLTTLTSLQLTNDGGRLDGKFVPPTLDGSCFRKLPLRRLSLDFTSMIPLRVDGTFHLLTSLESLELSSSCSVPVITLPRSLTGLSFLLELENFSIAGWEGISFYDVPGLRELRVVCGLTDPILCEIDGSLGYDLMGEAEPVDSLDLGVRWFAPALEVLVVDCSLVAAARHPDKEGALALTNGNAYYAPPGLRSLTATHLGHSSEQLLQQLTALPHLTRLCLPECHLTGAPALLQGLTQLQELQLQGLGQADLLRPSLGPLRALPRLRRLSLAECSLAGLDTEGLGPGWPALEELDLVYVELPHPPPWLGSLCPQLTRLGLDIDAAAENCAQLASLTPLRRLDLHFSDTTLPGSAVFLRSIDSARTPSVLDGDNNPDLSALPWVRQVPAAVQALPSLEQVGLPAPGRVALTSTCTTLRKHGAANPTLWNPLYLQLPEERLPQLEAWLDTKSSAVQSLFLDLQLTSGDWPALEAALEPLTALTSLQLSNYLGLSIDFSFNARLPLEGNFHLLSSLESLELRPSCSVTMVTLPCSLTHLSVPVDLETLSIAGWEGVFGDLTDGMPGLRELDIVFRFADPNLGIIADSITDFVEGEAVDSLDLGVGWFLPGLEVLAVDCSLIADEDPESNEAPALANAQDLPPGLRSLTARRIGQSSAQFLQQLAALENLTRLCLPECQLTEVPALLQGLTQLQELQLQERQEGMLGSSLAPLRAMPHLTRLSLAECSLAGLGTEGLGLGWPALKELDLAYVELPRRLPWLGSLSPQLTRLGLDIDAAARQLLGAKSPPVVLVTLNEKSAQGLLCNIQAAS
ncbi:hypothetical protein N2152v2_000101 [Parachlorella kessleri]